MRFSYRFKALDFRDLGQTEWFSRNPRSALCSVFLAAGLLFGCTSTALGQSSSNGSASPSAEQRAGQVLDSNNKQDGAAKSKARAKAKEDPFKNLPKSGAVLASIGSGAGSRAEQLVDSVKLVAKEGLPVSAGLSRQADKFVINVSNTAKKGITLSLKFTQASTQRRALKSDYLTVSLAPQSFQEREVSAALGANDASLELTGWRAR